LFYKEFTGRWGITTALDLFLVLCAVDMKQGFFFKFTAKFTLSLWHIPGQKYKNLFLSLYIQKTQSQVYRKLQEHKTSFYLQNKTCNPRVQA
jgi:hypothetical protein